MLDFDFHLANFVQSASRARLASSGYSALVDQQEHTIGAERRGRDELQRHRGVGLAEQLEAATEDDGEDHEP